MNRFGWLDALILTLIAAALCLFLWYASRPSGYTTVTVDSPPTVQPHSDTSSGPQELTVIYHGHPLHCVEFDVSFAGDRSCDFVRYHQEYP